MWYLIEAFLNGLIILTFVTQVLLPVLFRRPMFPAFRWRKVNKAYAQTIESLDLKDAYKAVEELQHSAAQEGEKKDGTK